MTSNAHQEALLRRYHKALDNLFALHGGPGQMQRVIDEEILDLLAETNALYPNLRVTVKYADEVFERARRKL